MKWHKAKVSKLQSGLSLENKHKQKKILKGGRDLKLKKWGEMKRLILSKNLKVES